ncbi:MAG: amidophosphoribosyltransferase [Gammaproteobacteria bacterium]|nr:amidophosphoribosyltransferase [Gammaproteobacteria bacterium]
MCGIVGLYLKNPEKRTQLGALFQPMLAEMKSRGPDSAGVAIYRNPVGEQQTKFSLAHDDAHYHWKSIDTGLEAALNCEASIQPIGSHAILVTNADEAEAIRWLRTEHASIRLVGSGKSLEIFKEVGLPDQVYAQFDLNHAEGSHMIGHTRMATESAVTTAGSHPFATGADLCLVHNGSLSNHNRLRELLKKEGIDFQTENDTEVAAAYMTWKLRQGNSLESALESALVDLDGFYTFCIGTSEGFAVLRDPIACKHAVLAENDDWVAMATEYRAIATLPDSVNATIWEPEPATIYSWGGHTH